MTIAVSIKVHDGLVLATDSASTLIDDQGRVINVYNNANKLFNLYKGRPIGAMTWGAGSIGSASMATLAKDLRRRFMGNDPDHAAWELAPAYTMEDVANRAKEFLYDELYVPAFAAAASKPEFGFLVAGYSSGANLAEEWRFKTDKTGACEGPILVRPLDETGMSWHGQPEAITRLVMGFGTAVPDALQGVGIAKKDISAVMDAIKARTRVSLSAAPMPIQDAIDLAEFLVKVTIGFSRFVPGPDSVGGPIEIAAVTKHEGFRWVKRKYWFDGAYNPEAPS